MLRFKRILNSILEFVCVLMFIFITIVGTYQIVTRYVFSSPSTVSEELLTYSFTWLSLLAAALVFSKREHMRMGFLADKFSGSTLKGIYVFSELLVILFAILVMTYGGYAITKLTTTQVTASLGIPMSAIYIIVPICGIVTILFSLINIYEIIISDYIEPLSKGEDEKTISQKMAARGQEMNDEVRGGE